MTIYDKTTEEKILFPVGIGILQTETTRNFYNTSDATAMSEDVVIGKSAYSRYGMINGTLDLEGEKNASYQEGYINGEYDGYADGYDAGVIDGEDNIIEGQSDATITPENVLRGYVGYGVNNERIVGESDAITSIDVGAMKLKFGFCNFTNIPDYYVFTNVDDVVNMFYECKKLENVPYINTSNCKNFNYMFQSCEKIKTIPQYDMSNATSISGMFQYCSELISLPLLDFSSINLNTFNNEPFTTYGGQTKLTTLGGFLNWGKSFSGSSSGTYYATIHLEALSALTRESVLNVFNTIYDMNLNTAYTGTPTIGLNTNTKNLLTDADIAIATNKGWVIS